MLILLGMPIAAAGILLMLSIWAFPVGLLLLPISGVPLGLAIYVHAMRKERQYEADLTRIRSTNTDTRPSYDQLLADMLADMPGPTDGEPPWEE